MWQWFKEKRRTWRRLSISLLPSAAAFCLFCNWWLVNSTASQVFTDLAQLPANEVALVLGASARTAGGYPNLHFQGRIEAAAAAYRHGKVKHLLLSGDNHVQGYDEPSDMKAALLARGVPEAAMTLDYAGFRTLDSVVRAKAIFGQQRLTVISDDFHVQRALFLCRAQGIDAVAFTAASVPEIYARKTRWREYLARVKAVLDIYVLGTQPKFYGPPVEINARNNGT